MKYQSFFDPLLISDYSRMMNDPEPEDNPNGQSLALLLDFHLPSSTYATMALREVMKRDTSVMNEIALQCEAKAAALNERALAADNGMVPANNENAPEVSNGSAPSANNGNTVSADNESVSETENENKRPAEGVEEVGVEAKKPKIGEVEVEASEAAKELKVEETEEDDSTAAKKIKLDETQVEAPEAMAE